MLLNFSDFFFFCHITVGRLFRNIHPSLQYSSRSLIHVSVYDMYTCTMPLPLGHGVHVHPALCLFPLVTVYMYILHCASSPWLQCTCTSRTVPLPLGYTVHVLLHYASSSWLRCAQFSFLGFSQLNISEPELIFKNDGQWTEGVSLFVHRISYSHFRC